MTARAASALPLLIVAILVACGGEPAEVQPARTYTLRGVVRELPEGERQEAITVHHEAIPDFVGLTGESEPMAAMTMTFTLDPELQLDGVAVGQKVEFDLVVDWDGSPPALVTRVAPLPTETELQF